MYYTREQLEEIEDTSLAPYGLRSKDSKGRVHPEEDKSSSFTKAIITAPG
ncbi:MAG: hypothetical protein P8Y14_14810 [Anaerolineales bacterium]